MLIAILVIELVILVVAVKTLQTVRNIRTMNANEQQLVTNLSEAFNKYTSKVGDAISTATKRISDLVAGGNTDSPDFVAGLNTQIDAINAAADHLDTFTVPPATPEAPLPPPRTPRRPRASSHPNPCTGRRVAVPGVLRQRFRVTPDHPIRRGAVDGARSVQNPMSSYPTATDLFCGAGGSSHGAELAGIEVMHAANHWKRACETYNQNHSIEAKCADVSASDPRMFGRTDILIASPECTNHSLAKGVRRVALDQDQMFGCDLCEALRSDRALPCRRMGHRQVRRSPPLPDRHPRERR